MTIQAHGAGTIAGQVRIHPVSLMAARLAIAGGTLCLVLLVLLHLLKPELDPSWRFVSEYATGQHGWLMGAGFLSLALGCAAVFLVVRSQVRGIAGYLGLAFLLLATVGLTLAAFFPMDLVTIDPAEATDAGRMHALASMIGVPSLPVAAMLISFNLGRQPGWSLARGPLQWSAVLMLLALVLMFATIGVLLPQNGGFGPAVLLGWPNRLLILAYCAWLVVVGRSAVSLARG